MALRGALVPRPVRPPPRVRRGASAPEAVALSAAGRWAQAAAAWRELLAAGALAPAARSLANCAAGDALQHLGEDDAAVEHFAAAEGAEKPPAAAALRLGLALRRVGRFEDAARAYRRLLRRPRRSQATAAELAAAVGGAALALLRSPQPWPRRAEQLLRGWARRDECGRAKGSSRNLLLLAMAVWLRRGRAKEVEDLLCQAEASAGPELLPLTQRLQTPQQAQEGEGELLALAAANRLVDFTAWGVLEDKCRLHELLMATLDQRRLRLCWPRSFAVPKQAAAAAPAFLTSSGWWLKAASGHGGHSAHYLPPGRVVEAIQGVRKPHLLQEDKDATLAWTCVVLGPVLSMECAETRPSQTLLKRGLVTVCKPTCPFLYAKLQGLCAAGWAPLYVAPVPGLCEGLLLLFHRCFGVLRAGRFQGHQPLEGGVGAPRGGQRPGPELRAEPRGPASGG
ncbi:unnamed protein product, partial [Effrenium voratum]